MADNGFRRDGAARNARSPQRDTSDPLAELARLIGQSDAHRGFARDTSRQADSYDEAPAAAANWGAADEDYAEDNHADDRYAPRSNEAYQSQPVADARQYDGGYDDGAYEDEDAGARQYARAPAEDPRNARRNAASHYADEQPRHSRAEPLPYIPPAQGNYLADAEDTEEQGYDENDVEAPPARRSGTIVIVAILGLAVLGTAGALGYRAMFGGSVIPSLPPIIKPGDAPIKIVPKHDAQAGANQTDADAKDTTDQIVSHEEQPVNVQSANGPEPRVVTTIPVISNAPDAPLPDSQASATPGSADGTGTVPPPSAGEANGAVQPFGPPPEQLTGPAPATTAPEARPVHTLSILPPQSSAGADAAPPPPPAHVRQPAARPNWPSGEHTAAVGPLSIVPGQDDGTAQARPRSRTTSAPGPMALNSSTAAPAEAAPERGGGFAVQVTSQRSEAEAQAAFHALQAKYPQQLGDRHAFVRRADLGAKGVYYRALIGPFASGQEAVSLCSSLKAAGGSCLIQRD